MNIASMKMSCLEYEKLRRDIFDLRYVSKRCYDERQRLSLLEAYVVPSVPRLPFFAPASKSSFCLYMYLYAERTADLWPS